MRFFPLVLIFIMAGSSTFEPTSNFSHPDRTRDDHSFTILETPTDSTKPLDQMTATEKMDAHVIHFTGAIMSDTFVLTHFSRAFVNDQYSDFLKPGRYSDGYKCLPKSIASSLDGIAIPKKTRLVVYNQTNLAGTVLLDVTGPAIINNSIYETTELYAQANKKNYSGGLQAIFPQKVRQWTGKDGNGMSYWQNFSFEIKVES